MMSLKDAWREQQQQRQQEAAQRHQQVCETLAAFQRDRHTKAIQLRDDLSLFQLELQENTRNLLVHISQQRQAQAQEVTRQLQDFSQQLQAQTAQFLNLVAANRVLMSQQLTQELNHFHTDLHQSVAVLRQDLQANVQQIQHYVQTLLQTSHEQRVQRHSLLFQELTRYVETLRSEVETYLAELELMRQDRAQQLQQTLQHDRDRRTAEVNALFQQLSIFRDELRQYCASLRQAVWGDSPTTGLTAAAPSLAATLQSLPTVPVAKGREQPVALVELVEPTQAVVKATPATKPTATATEPLEESIYNYIHQIQGARLTEIETSLKINRFQVVDALRALIKKGLITQRDRVYLVQEEAM
ncbi:hypothetical protein IQ268_04440 [Oculatella sp. LEGE 06141]|uniref:hypothetical protein n=1 Tax=Oculatella sp. LEGE 06141 TaxID=1828648 RepID=UPI00187E11AF|nr:hypothetical protein [Oculatella sp. LEGE 06141]MBE9177830.1 hypothetical protein [Oculatella sp. LEGE 06141]